MSQVPLKALSKACMVRGILIGSRTQYVSNCYLAIRAYTHRHPFRFEDMNRLISSQQIKPVVDKVFSFDEAEAAYKYLESQKHVGKVVIKVAQ